MTDEVRGLASQIEALQRATDSKMEALQRAADDKLSQVAKESDDKFKLLDSKLNAIIQALALASSAQGDGAEAAAAPTSAE